MEAPAAPEQPGPAAPLLRVRALDERADKQARKLATKNWPPVKPGNPFVLFVDGLSLEEYSQEMLDYLNVAWGTKRMKDVQRRRLALIRRKLRWELGPSNTIKICLKCSVCCSLLMLL